MKEEAELRMQLKGFPPQKQPEKCFLVQPQKGTESMTAAGGDQTAVGAARRTQQRCPHSDGFAVKQTWRVRRPRGLQQRSESFYHLRLSLCFLTRHNGSSCQPRFCPSSCCHAFLPWHTTSSTGSRNEPFLLKWLLVRYLVTAMRKVRQKQPGSLFLDHDHHIWLRTNYLLFPLRWEMDFMLMVG